MGPKTSRRRAEDSEAQQQLRDMNEALLLASVRQQELADEAGRAAELASQALSRSELARRALNVSQEQFRRAIEEAPIPVIMHAEDGEVLQISRTWTELTGYTREDDKVIKSWLTRAYGFGGDEVRDAMQRAFLPPKTGDRPMRSVLFDIVTRDGDQRTWSFSASTPGILSDGRRFVVGTAEDITERIKTEDALRRSEERFRLLIESATEFAIFTLTPKGIVDSWNSGAEKVFSWPDVEIIGRPGDILFTPEDRRAGIPEKEMKTALKSGVASDERWHQRRDGSRFFASGVMTLLRDQDGNPIGFTKIARDLTSRLQVESAVRDREMMYRLVEAQEVERQRIARD
jgi:PAS domain S-box-containing protein